MFSYIYLAQLNLLFDHYLVNENDNRLREYGYYYIGKAFLGSQEQCCQA